MKKELILLMAVTIMGCLSCKKETELTENNISSVPVESKKLQSFASRGSNDIQALNFSSEEIYNQVLESQNVNNLSPIDGYSVYTSLANKTNLTGINPAYDYSEYGLLYNILNEDSIVIIDNWIIKVDLPNERVLSLSTDKISQYQDLINNRLDNANILVASTEDDVLEILNDPQSINRCKEEGAPVRSATENIPTSYKRRIDAKVVYQKAGIYFALVGKGKSQKDISPEATTTIIFPSIWVADNANQPYLEYTNYTYKGKCRDVRSYTGTIPNQYRHDNVSVYRPYESSHGLTYFYFSVEFLRNSNPAGILTIRYGL